MAALNDNVVPYFAWDRNWTVGQIKQRLRVSGEYERSACISWILREAAFEDVWQFLTPQLVHESLPRISNNLGRKKAFWTYIIRTWRELGKL